MTENLLLNMGLLYKPIHYYALDLMLTSIALPEVHSKLLKAGPAAQQPHRPHFKVAGGGAPRLASPASMLVFSKNYINGFAVS